MLQPFFYLGLFLHVLIPKGRYNGQKLRKLVKTKITATLNSIIAKVPEITFIKYKTAIAIATMNLISLSAIPIFFFMS